MIWTLAVEVKEEERLVIVGGDEESKCRLVIPENNCTKEKKRTVGFLVIITDTVYLFWFYLCVYCVCDYFEEASQGKGGIFKA